MAVVDRSHLSKTHVPSPARAQKRDGSIDMKVVEKDAKKTYELFKSGKEVLLNLERVVLRDGVVCDMFFHTDSKNAAKLAQPSE